MDRLPPDLRRGSAPTRVVVCVPTYEEAQNVERLCREVLEALTQAGADPLVLVIDDGSPDGTQDVVRALGADDSRVHLLAREAKEGLGPAYRAGFSRALDLGGDLICQMDADLSHDPGDLPALVAAAQSADLVLGSRYCRGGRIERWGPVRRLLSRGGSLYARLILGVPAHDLTGGFKCWRREVLERLDLAAVTTAGYGFQVEMTWRAHRAGARVVEVPITFRERTAGHSKMTPAIALEAVTAIPRLRMGRSRRTR